MVDSMITFSKFVLLERKW